MAGNETKAVKAKTQKPKKQRQKGRAAKFFKEFFGEVKKLNWLTFGELVKVSLAVLAFVAICAVLIGVLDFAFGEGVKLLSTLKLG